MKYTDIRAPAIMCRCDKVSLFQMLTKSLTQLLYMKFLGLIKGILQCCVRLCDTYTKKPESHYTDVLDMFEVV